jgi:hypothetical protein
MKKLMIRNLLRHDKKKEEQDTSVSLTNYDFVLGDFIGQGAFGKVIFVG